MTYIDEKFGKINKKGRKVPLGTGERVEV